MEALPLLHGFGADGVKNSEFLLAYGNLINTNAKEDPDFYRALKGGGSNFVGMFFRDHEAEPPKASRPFHNLKVLVATVLPSTNGTLLSFSQALDEVGHAQTSQK
ncbi:hypothetical protein AtubIFM57258_004834 [Aspergillus tubingensis]|nr:hypothetical protein AtubIFM57258_004834 [Aspergillus tubingensis]